MDGKSIATPFDNGGDQCGQEPGQAAGYHSFVDWAPLPGPTIVGLPVTTRVLTSRPMQEFGQTA